MAFPQTLSQPLQHLYQTTRETLEDEGFMFQLFLPDDNDESVTVFDRADALSGWVNHFLLGLGVVQPRLNKTRGELKEAIDDLRNIAQLGYDEDEDQEELEQSLEEVIEYVRVSAILCHNEFMSPPVIAPQRQNRRCIDFIATRIPTRGMVNRAEYFQEQEMNQQEFLRRRQTLLEKMAPPARRLFFRPRSDAQCRQRLSLPPKQRLLVFHRF